MYTYLISAASIGLVGWQLIVWFGEIRDKNRKFAAAKAQSSQTNKPLLVCGGPWGSKPFRRLLHMPAHRGGDYCLDIDRHAVDGEPNSVVASVTQVPFVDKSFGAVFASHLLEHMPDIATAKQALAELNRISDAVFIACPSRQSLIARMMLEHHVWVWQEDGRIYLKLKGKPGEPVVGLELAHK